MEDEAEAVGTAVEVEVEEKDAMEQLVSGLSALKNMSDGGFFSRLKMDPKDVEALIGLAKEAKTIVNEERARADKAHARADEARKETLSVERSATKQVEQAEKKSERKMELATERQFKANALQARANDIYEKAEKQLETVDAAREHRDNSHRELSLLQGEANTLARAFGWDPMKGKGPKDASEAIRWVLGHVEKKRTESELATTDAKAASKIARLSCLADLEGLRDKLDEGGGEGWAKEQLDDLAKRWRAITEPS